MQGGPSSGQGQHESQMFQHLKDQAQHGNDASQASDKKKFLACLLTTLLTVSNCHYSKKDSIPTIINRQHPNNYSNFDLFRVLFSSKHYIRLFNLQVFLAQMVI